MLLGCDEQPRSGDPGYFVEATAASDLQTAATMCSHIDEVGLRGECLTHVVREHGASDVDAGLEHCRTAEGAWKDECIFLLAEVDPRPPAEAAALCREAGQYAISCLMHLWQEEAARLEDTLAPGEAVAAYSETLPWAGELLDDVLRQRAWSLFYRTGLDADEAIDVAGCDALSDEHVTYCRRGTQEALARSLNVWVRENGPTRMLELCALETAQERASAIEERTGLGYVPSSGLDAIAKAQIDRQCEMESRRR